MPIQKIVTLYQYDELPTDAAKEKARDWFREATAGDTFYAESVTDDFKEVCERMGVTIATRRDADAIFWSGFSSQGDGASFAGQVKPTGQALAAIREYAPQDAVLAQIALALDALAVAYPGLTGDISQEGRYVHEMTMDCVATVTIEDEDGDDSAPEAAETELQNLMRALARWLYRTLESAYDDDRADEQVEENIRANEYTFLESGKRED